jgi:hypothetical protein
MSAQIERVATWIAVASATLCTVSFRLSGCQSDNAKLTLADELSNTLQFTQGHQVEA